MTSHARVSSEKREEKKRENETERIARQKYGRRARARDRPANRGLVLSDPFSRFCFYSPVPRPPSPAKQVALTYDRPIGRTDEMRAIIGAGAARLSRRVVRHRLLRGVTPDRYVAICIRLIVGSWPSDTLCVEPGAPRRVASRRRRIAIRALL